MIIQLLRHMNTAEFFGFFFLQKSLKCKIVTTLVIVARVYIEAE